MLAKKLESAAKAVEAVYVEEVFQSWLYTGNGSTQTITNGIDLSGEGGLVWIKDRTAANPAWIMDTVRGVASTLQPSTTGAAGSISNAITAFNAAGFSLGANLNSNTSGNNYASWTFREQSKFYTQKQISHTNGTPTNIDLSTLGTVGYLHAKITNTTGDWIVWHLSLTAGNNLRLNTTAAQSTTNAWLSVSSTTATLSASAPTGTYIIHAFAHDAGGFGLTGTDNVISCGSYTGNGATNGPTVSLGYEPQWLMIKNASGTGNWQIIDNMRGMPVGSADATLQANLANAESSVDYVSPTATGFQVVSTSSQVNTNASTYIYIAIRRGPMKTPTSGTSVFAPVTRTGTGTAPWVASGAGFPPDMTIMSARTGTAIAGTSYQHSVIDRLRRATEHIQTVSANAEGGGWGSGHIHNMDGYDGLYASDGSYFNENGILFVDNHFRRAPGFFDVVCFTGNGATSRVVNHGLNAVPEISILKNRSDANSYWLVHHPLAGNVSNGMVLPDTSGNTGAGIYANVAGALTASTFTLGNTTNVNYGQNLSGKNYVWYGFATVAGVSKVGSYTGTGAAQTINCGFTAGARFLMIKRTDSTGDWYFWDTARGIISGNDPYLLLNSTAAEVTTTDYISPQSVGFGLTASAPAALNANGGTFIFLAVA